MFKETLQARRKRRRLFARIIGFFGATDLDLNMPRYLRGFWGHEDKEGYGN